VRGDISRDLRPDQNLEILNNTNPEVLAFHFAEPGQDPGTIWTVEAAIFRAGERRKLFVRVGLTVRGAKPAFVPAAPAFLKKIAEQADLSADGWRIQRKPHRIDSAEDAETFAELLLDPARTLPIVAISDDTSNSADQRVSDLSGITGLAHVFLVGEEASWALTRHFGKEWSVYQGAIRLYWPGFNPDSQSRYEHPLYLSQRLAMYGPQPVVEEIVRRLAERSIGSPDALRRFPPFAALRAQLESLRLSRPAESDQTEAQTIVNLREALRQREIEANELALISDANFAEQQRELDKLNGALEETKRTNHALRQQLRRLEERSSLTSSSEAMPSPTNYDGLSDWVIERFPERLALATTVRPKELGFIDIKLVCEALEALAQDYVSMRRLGGGRQDFEARLNRLGIEDTAIAANPDRFRKKPQYLTRHEGRTLFTERHLKKGNSRDRRECLRIYYAWDQEAAMVVVGRMTEHLPTDVS